MCADGNVVVEANDDTTSYAIGGAVGVGIGAGGGAGAVNVTSITGTVLATITDAAIVDAEGNNGSMSQVPNGANADSNGEFPTKTTSGVAVLASSSQTVDSVDASIGGGTYAGIAGAASVELINVDTAAIIGDNVAINQSTVGTPSTNQSVVVDATNYLNILTYAGGLGVSAGGGVGASVDIGMLQNDTQALIGAASVRASNEVDVFSLSDWMVNSNAISAGAGSVGIGGGIIVYTIGGNFSDTYSASGSSASALSGQNNSTVTSFVDSTIGGLTSQAETNDPTLPSFDPATAISGDAINLGTDSGLETGDTVVYDANGGTAINGLTDGQTYFAIVNSADPDEVQLASSYENAEAGNAIAISYSEMTGNQQTLASGNAGLADMGRAAVSRDAPPNVGTALGSTALISGTTAGIDNNAVIVTGTLDLQANEDLDYTGRAGAIGIGGAASLGVGIAVFNSDTPVTAYIAPGVTIEGGINPGDDLTVAATLNSTVNLLGFAGAISGFVSLGGAVSVINDSSAAVATIGASPTDNDTQFSEASSTSDATTITGFDDVNVESTATVTHNLADGAAAVSGIVGLGAAVTSDTITGSSQAVIGDYTQIGSVTGATINPVAGAVTVNAQRTVNINPFSSGAPMGIAIGGGGIVGAAAGVTIIDVSGTVAATVGNTAAIYAAAAVAVEATSNVTADQIDVDGIAIGGIAVGVVIAQTTIEPTVEADIGKRTLINAASLDLSANNTTNADEDGTAAGGGVGSGEGLEITLQVDPTTSVLIDNDANIDVSGAVSAISTANTTAQADGDSGNYGGIVVIVGGATTSLTNINSATVGSDAQVTGKTGVEVEANSTNVTNAGGDGGSGGLVAIMQAEADINETDDTTTTIGAGVQLDADEGDVDVESITSTSAITDPTSSGAGLGANTETDTTITYGGTTTTDIGAGAELTALENVNVFATVSDLDLEATATATSSALGADSTANATIEPPPDAAISDASVDVESGAVISADEAVNIEAMHPDITSYAYAHATTNGLGADTTTNATNDFDVITNVTTATGSQINTHALTVEANATPSISSFTDADSDGAVIDVGSQNANQTLNYTRTITFNSGVDLFGPPSPFLDVAQNGDITEVGIDGPIVISGGNVIVPDITFDSSAVGSAYFYIPAWYDDPSPAGYGTSPGEDSIQGSASFTFESAFQTVTITNESDNNLIVNLIDPISPTPGVAGAVTVDVTDKTKFGSVNLVHSDGTVITIDNTWTTSPTNVTLDGDIDNVFGTTEISTAAGNIFAAPGGSVETTTLSLSAPFGVIGQSSAPLPITATLLDATAGDGIWIDATGDLTLGTVISASGSVNLNATGSILDGETGATINVTGPVINLNAGSGSIGLADDALSIATANMPETLNATATTGINLLDNSLGVGVGTVVSTSGDITIATSDSSPVGEDIGLDANSFVKTGTGTVTLQAGGNLVLSAGSVIDAAENVILGGDLGNANVGTLIALEGTIAAAAVMVASGNDNDTILIRKAGSPTIVSLGSGQDEVLIGSQATATIDSATNLVASTSNTGGVLSGITAALTINGASDTRSDLSIDDSAYAATASGQITDDSVTGFDMTGSIAYSNIDNLHVTLGNGNDSLNVLSTAAIAGNAAGTQTTVTLGNGNNTVAVSDAGTLDQINGALILAGGSGTNTLLVDDSAEQTDETGTLGGTNGNQILGFNMGSTDPTMPNPSAGIAYSGFATITFDTGAGADTITLDGTAAGATNTFIDTGSGADTITVGPTPSQFQSPVEINGKASDKVIVSFSGQTNLTLNNSTSTADILTAAGMQPIQVNEVGLLEIDLSDATNTVTVLNTVVPLKVQATGGTDTIIVDNISAATALDLGTGTDTVTVFGADALLNVNGAGSNDTMTVNDTAATDAVVNSAGNPAGIFDDAAAGQGGIVEGVTTGDLAFNNLVEVTVLLGSGNNDFMIDVASAFLPATELDIVGGSGNDFFEAESISAGAPTIINGGGGSNTLQVDIAGAPVNDEFTSIEMTVQMLIVNDTANTSTPIGWTLNDPTYDTANDTDNLLVASTINAAGTPTSSLVAVISTAGADTTEIFGSQTNEDRLTVNPATASDVNATVSGNTITLASGFDALSQPDPATDFTTYLDYTGPVINFDTLTSTNPYVSNGFSFSSSNGSLTRSDAISPSLSIAAGETISMSAVDGDAFELDSLELANTSGSSATVEISGVSLINGQTVPPQDVIIPANSTFSLYTSDDTLLSSAFDMSKATITVKSGSAQLTNVVAQTTLAAATAPAASAIPALTLFGNIGIDTDTGTVTDNGTVVNSPILTAALLATGEEQFTVSGDLVIGDNSTVTVTGSAALSINVLNNVSIGDNVVLDVSAPNSQSATGVTNAAGTAGGGGGGQAGGGGTPTAGAAGGSGVYTGTNFNDQGGSGGSGASGDDHGGHDGGDIVIDGTSTPAPGDPGGTVPAGNPGGTGNGGGSGFNDAGSGGAGGGAGAAGGDSNETPAAPGTSGTGGSGGGGSQGDAGSGNPGNPGGNGANGDDGGNGVSGNAGGAGENLGSGSQISGGGGGGGGAGGGGGQGGGGGAGGGAGGGGGGGGSSIAYGGGDGGTGGTGGSGANGADGGAGGDGGDGGAGGGAFEIVAQGTLTVGDGSDFAADGGNATAEGGGQPGGTDQTVDQNENYNLGQSNGGGSSGPGGTKGGAGGDGGVGGTGGLGGTGGSGGDGGKGAGGAGGTVKLDATNVEAQGAQHRRARRSGRFFIAQRRQRPGHHRHQRGRRG